ncbi:MAG TPA: thioredoxin family protein [Pirellula sp.]|nr:thioredoxin family protein [Pirellula sp.]
MLKHFFVAGFMLRTVTILLVPTIVLFTPASGIGQEREIAWTEDYDAAVQHAATTNSIVLLHFYGDYCPPCKLLDRKTFRDPTLISKINEQLVPVKLNADRRRDLAQKFQVTRWPTDIYLLPSGEEIYRGVSNPDPTVYCKTIDRVAIQHRNRNVGNATAPAHVERQDRALGGNAPQIQSEQSNYAPFVGDPVRSKASAWTERSGAPQPNISLTAKLVPANPSSRVIENPYIDKLPTAKAPSPAVEAPAVKTPNKLPPIVTNDQHLVGSNPSTSVSNQSAKPVAAQPVRAQRTPDVQPYTAVETQRVYAETIGLGGYCPVSLIQSLDRPNVNGWVEGKNTSAVRHRGRVYYCANEQARQTLLSDPDRYTPCLSGFDIVHLCKAGELHDGLCDYGCIQEGTNRVFLFENKANYEEFNKNSVYYSGLLDNDGTEHVATELNGTLNR